MPVMSRRFERDEHPDRVLPTTDLRRGSLHNRLRKTLQTRSR